MKLVTLKSQIGFLLSTGLNVPHKEWMLFQCWAGWQKPWRKPHARWTLTASSDWLNWNKNMKHDTFETFFILCARHIVNCIIWGLGPIAETGSLKSYFYSSAVILTITNEQPQIINFDYLLDLQTSNCVVDSNILKILNILNIWVFLLWYKGITLWTKFGIRVFHNPEPYYLFIT